MPFEIRCENYIYGKRCEGFARSQFYDLGDGNTMLRVATHMFYFPTSLELKTWFDKWRFQNGQLFLRKIR